MLVGVVMDEPCAPMTHPLTQNQPTKYEREERLDLLLNVIIFEYESWNGLCKSSNLTKPAVLNLILLIRTAWGPLKFMNAGTPSETK